MSSSKKVVQRLACKLLFQHRVMINGKPGKFRKCEVRTVVFDCVENDLYDAVDRVFAYARSQQRNYMNTAGRKVYFEFVGILDFIRLGGECDENEMWYDYVVKKEPMENRENTTFSKSEIKKKIRQELEKLKEPLDPKMHSNDRSHMNINYDLEKILNDWARRRDLLEKSKENQQGSCDEDFSEQELQNTEPQS
jgi:hypothetical protein